MAQFRGVYDLRADQMPLDQRIAKFWAGIQQADATNSQQAFLENASHAPDLNDMALPEAAPQLDEESDPQPDAPEPARRQRAGPSRRRRYRDEKQKLSNSMAQKRYRERKKRAFDNMKALVDSLTAEVDRLQFVKKENEKLTLEMQEYRHLAELHGMQTMQSQPQQQQPPQPPQPLQQQPHHHSLGHSSGSSSLVEATSPSSVTALPIVCPPNSNPATTETPAQQLLSIQNLHGTDWIGTLNHISQCHNPLPLDASVSLEEKVMQLEKDWNERMLAVERILQLHQLYGSPVNASPDSAVPPLRACIANLYSMNLDLSSMRLQQVSQQTRTNNERIQNAFIFLSTDSK